MYFWLNRPMSNLLLLRLYIDPVSVRPQLSVNSVILFYAYFQTLLSASRSRASITFSAISAVSSANTPLIFQPLPDNPRFADNSAWQIGHVVFLKNNRPARYSTALPQHIQYILSLPSTITTPVLSAHTRPAERDAGSSPSIR